MKHSVGIFSRSDQREYAWLMTLLSSSDFSDRVQDVRSTIISNSGFQQFFDDASQCSLGILYHTKNRGRINITDISGSLYNEELYNLNKLLGRDNVIVVVDDVEDSSHGEKIRILECQPTIRKLASDLLLISKTEKNNTKTSMTKLRSMTPFNSTSGSSTYGGPDPLSGRHNLEEKLTDKTNHGTEDIKPLHGDKSPNTKPTHEILKPWISIKSPEESFRDEGPPIWNDYDGFKSMRKSSIPMGSDEESEIPLSNTQFCNIYYEIQKIPPSIENLGTWPSCETENIYETPDSWINDQPDPKPKRKSTIWYISNHSEMLPDNESQEDEFCSKTSNIGTDSDISEKPPSKGYPTYQTNNETSRTRYSSEGSKKPAIDEFSGIHLYNKHSEMLPDNEYQEDEFCSKTSNIGTDSEISEKPPTKGYPTYQTNNETSRTRYSSEGSKKPAIDEFSGIHLYYDGFKSMRKTSIPMGSDEESEIPLSNTQFCNIYYESQKIPPSIENLGTWPSCETENIYETPDSWINDQPDPKPKRKSTIWYISNHSEMLPDNESQEDEFCSKTSNIGTDSEILERPPTKGYPTYQTNNETSRTRYGSEGSKKPPIDEFSGIHLYNKHSEMLPDNEYQEDEFCSKTSNIGTDSEISERPPSKGYPTYQTNNETSRTRYSSEGSKKPAIDEFSGIHLYYDGFKSMRKTSIPMGSDEESEIPLSNTQFCNIYYESQKIPPSIENLGTWPSCETENIYETPDSWINDQPDPKPKRKSTIWYISNHSEMLPDNESQEDEFCSKTSNIGTDSEISERPPTKGYPTYQTNNETSRTRYGSEGSKKPPIDEFSGIHLYNKHSEMLPDNEYQEDEFCSKTSNIGTDSEISERPPSKGYPTYQTNNETSRTRYSSEGSKKPAIDEFSGIHSYNKHSEMLPDNEYQEDEFCSKPSNIGTDSEISERPSSKGYPTYQANNETSRTRYSSEGSKKPAIGEFSGIHLYNKHSEMLPDNEYQEDEFCSKTSNIGTNFEISERPPSKGYPTYQTNNETSRTRYSSEGSKKPAIDEFSGIHLYNKPSEIGFTYKSSGSNPRCERSEELCDNSDSMCKGEIRDTRIRKKSPKAQKSPKSQSIDPNFSDVIDELKRKQNEKKNLPH